MGSRRVGLKGDGGLRYARRGSLIAGGGIAGLEAVLALADLAGARASISLVAPEPEFVFKPLAVEEPFTCKPAERHELAPALAELGGEFIEGALLEVDAGAREAVLGDGSRLGYDYLFVCIGGRTRPAFTGRRDLLERSHRRPDRQDDRRARTASEARTLNLRRPAGNQLAVAAVRARAVDPAPHRGARDARARDPGADARAARRWRSSAASPGTAVSELLAARRISVETDRYVVQDAEGRLRPSTSGEPFDADLSLALPVISGPADPRPSGRR